MRALGRETPLSLTVVSKPEQELKVAVAFADGIELLGGGEQSLCTIGAHNLALECLTRLPAGFLAGGSQLSLLDEELEIRSRVESPDAEPIRAILPLSADRFLTLSDDETVRLWTFQEESQLALARQWPVGCTPLFARTGGKSVTCVERGRLQDRDPLTGTILRTWKHKGTVVSAFSDGGDCAVTVDDQGLAWVWDLHSREQLFALDWPEIAHGAMRATGGVVLNSSGEVATFRMVDGGSVEPLGEELPPMVDVAYADSLVLGLDENGGLWSLSEEPHRLGGSWAGWSTAALAQSSRALVGTASGEILSYPLSSGPALEQVKPHQDAVLELLECGEDLLSVGADGRVFRYPQGQLDSPQEIGSFLGEAVVACRLSRDGTRLWVALEEGHLSWLDPRTGEETGDYTFDEHRIEEIRPGANRCQLVLLTDKGSAKLFTSTP